MPAEIAPFVSAALPPLRFSWFFMLAASLAWAGLGLFASPAFSPPDAPALSPVTAALTTLGVLSALAALWLDRAALTPKRMAAIIPVPDQELVRRHLFAGHLILWSIAELPALFGFTQLLLGGPLGTHLALCAVSLAMLAILMPTRARITTRMAAVLR